MWFLYLDESGDLGFDFVNKKPSKYFTISILAVKGWLNNRRVLFAVDKTLKRKLNKRSKRKRKVNELKGNTTTFEVKKYLYSLLKDVEFNLYSITLNKKKVYEALTKQKSHVYNYVARLVLDKIPFEKGPQRVYFTIDKSKSKSEVKEFNDYIIKQLEGRLDPKIPLDIIHADSVKNKGIQAVDVMCWGIFRKYERKSQEWYDVFREKIVYEELY